MAELGLLLPSVLLLPLFLQHLISDLEIEPRSELGLVADSVTVSVKEERRRRKSDTDASDDGGDPLETLVGDPLGDDEGQSGTDGGTDDGAEVIEKKAHEVSDNGKSANEIGGIETYLAARADAAYIM